MTKLFDIACNFTSERFDSDLDDVISNAIKNNVDKFLVVSAELDDTKKIQEIKKKYSKNCFITLGVHPHHAKTFNDKSSNHAAPVSRLFGWRKAAATLINLISSPNTKSGIETLVVLTAKNVSVAKEESKKTDVTALSKSTALISKSLNANAISK